MLAAGSVVHALATRLTGLPIAGASVFTDRVWPLAESDLPAWRVIAGQEEVEQQTIHAPAIELHALHVALQGNVRIVTTIDDAMNAMAAEALTAVFASSPPADDLAGIASKLQISLLRVDRETAKEGESAVGQITVTLHVNFRVRANAPETLF